jgi:integrase
MVVSVIVNIGIAHCNPNLYHIAKPYFLRALVQYKVSRKRLSPHGLRHTLNVAERCEKIGEFEIALKYYQLTLAEYEKKIRHVSRQTVYSTKFGLVVPLTW